MPQTTSENVLSPILPTTTGPIHHQWSEETRRGAVEMSVRPLHAWWVAHQACVRATEVLLTRKHSPTVLIIGE